MRLDRCVGLRRRGCLLGSNEKTTSFREVTVLRIWAGVDIGKEYHHCVVIDAEGRRLLSRRVLNDEAVLLELIGDVLAIDPDVPWAVDLNQEPAKPLVGCCWPAARAWGISPAWLCIGLRAPTGARARAMPRTPSSSPTRPACAGIWACCSPATR
jgi:hypothetical protein